MGLIKWAFLIISIFMIQSSPSLSEYFITKEKLAEIPLNFLNWAKKTELVDYMVNIRRSLHENPELGYEEFETSKLIRTELDKLGISYRHTVAVTGVVGYIGTGKPPFVAIRADMDALAMQEEVEWEHKSKVPGKMHGCGHDAHVSMLLGAAKMLQDHRYEIPGTVVLVFQPAEEGGGGAKKMLDEGILENVDAIFGLHVSVRFPIGTVSSRVGPVLAASGFFEAVISGKGGHAAIPHHSIDPIVAASNVIISLQNLVSREADPLESQEGGGGAKKMLDEGILENVDAIFGLHVSVRFPIGTVSSRVGPVLAASGFFEAVISGKGGHAAIPHHSIDPIVAASNVIISLQNLVSREADPLESQVVTVGRFQGGGAFNVIPDAVTIGGTFRAFSKQGFIKLKQRIKEVITAQAGVHRCNAIVDFNESEKPLYPPLINHKDLHLHFKRVAKDMLGAKNIFECPLSLGAEDFAFFTEAIPGYFFFVGMQDESGDKLASSHSPYFTVNEDVLPYGAAFHASLVTRYLLEHEIGVDIQKVSSHDEL